MGHHDVMIGTKVCVHSGVALILNTLLKLLKSRCSLDYINFWLQIVSEMPTGIPQLVLVSIMQSVVMVWYYLRHLCRSFAGCRFLDQCILVKCVSATIFNVVWTPGDISAVVREECYHATPSTPSSHHYLAVQLWLAIGTVSVLS